jgi:hypothetical protein
MENWQVETAYENYLQTAYDENTSGKADFEIWTSKNCMDFETWFNEHRDETEEED